MSHPEKIYLMEVVAIKTDHKTIYFMVTNPKNQSATFSTVSALIFIHQSMQQRSQNTRIKTRTNQMSLIVK